MCNYVLYVFNNKHRDIGTPVCPHPLQSKTHDYQVTVLDCHQQITQLIF